jgi:hypothetical protein
MPVNFADHIDMAAFKAAITAILTTDEAATEHEAPCRMVAAAAPAITASFYRYRWLTAYRTGGVVALVNGRLIPKNPPHQHAEY